MSALDVDAIRKRETERFDDPGVARVAFRVHEVYHDGLRCGYACDFWHGLVAALHEVRGGSILAALNGYPEDPPAPTPSSDAHTEQKGAGR